MKCRDYYIYRIQYYKKHWKVDKNREEMFAAARRLNAFKVSLIEHFLGTTYEEVVDEYRFGAMQCGLVLVERLTGIIFDDAPRYCTLLIPITNSEAIGWARANTVEFHTQRLKRIRTAWRMRTGDKLWQLDHYRVKI